MKRRPWYPRYGGDRILQFQDENRLVGMAVTNLEDRASVEPGYRLPNDPVKLRRWSRLTPKEWGKLGARVLILLSSSSAPTDVLQISRSIAGATQSGGEIRAERVFEGVTEYRKSKGRNESGTQSGDPSQHYNAQHCTTQHRESSSASSQGLDLRDSPRRSAPRVRDPVASDRRSKDQPHPDAQPEPPWDESGATAWPGDKRHPDFPWHSDGFISQLGFRGQAAMALRDAYVATFGRNPEDPPPGWVNRTGKWEQRAVPPPVAQGEDLCTRAGSQEQPDVEDPEAIDERVAIMELDGGLSREAAEAGARGLSVWGRGEGR